MSNQENPPLTEQNVPQPHWRVWKAISTLETNGMTTTIPNSCYDETTAQVVAILRQWAHKWAGKPEWQSLLNKKSLLHEAEESIVALYHLHEWLLTRQHETEPLVVMDICSGKGIFSMFLSYMMQNFWRDDAIITKIVMLDKMTSDQVSWKHISAANESASEEHRPHVEIWEGCNLHEHDKVLTRMLDLNSTLALVGIHLCKTLGPSCCGLANALGPKRCPYLCLAPCCMPRLVTTKKSNKARSIPVNLYESDEQRQDRLEAMQRRNEALRKGGRHGLCYLCNEKHRVRKCPLLPENEAERIAILQKAAATVPCWKCGEVGHFKADCPSSLSRPLNLEAPFVTMNVQGLLETSHPFSLYCQLIADTLQDCSSKKLVETGLTNDASPHQEGNWNSDRKSTYIVASR
jgi:hypothetical protein